MTDHQWEVIRQYEADILALPADNPSRILYEAVSDLQDRIEWQQDLTQTYIEVLTASK